MPNGANPVWAVGKNRYIISGSFRPNTAGALVSTLGSGFTVVRTSTGLFTVTLNEKYMRLLSGQIEQGRSAIANHGYQFGLTDVSGAKTVQIRSWVVTGAGDSTGIVGDVASNASNWIHFKLLLSNDTVQT